MIGCFPLITLFMPSQSGSVSHFTIQELWHIGKNLYETRKEPELDHILIHKMKFSAVFRYYTNYHLRYSCDTYQDRFWQYWRWCQVGTSNNKELQCPIFALTMGSIWIGLYYPLFKAVLWKWQISPKSVWCMLIRKSAHWYLRLVLR